MHLIRVHVKDGSGDVGAIKEHFCSAGRCDDSFMRVAGERSGTRRYEVRDTEAEREGSRLRGNKALRSLAEVMSEGVTRHTDRPLCSMSSLSASRKAKNGTCQLRIQVTAHIITSYI